MTTRASSWTEATVIALMRRHRSEEPEQIIDRFARKCLQDARQDRLPIEIEGIASLFGIRRRFGDYPFAGRIFAEPSGQLVMDLNALDSETRRRFTCGHEITHTAFPGFATEGRYRSDRATGAYDARRNEEEYLCDRGAAALLMPAGMIGEIFSLRNGLRDMEGLSDAARVSLEAAANRLLQLTDTRSAVIVMEVGHKPADRPALRRGRDIAPRLRVRYARTQALTAYVPKYKSASDDSPFVRALTGDDIVSGVGYLPGAERAGIFAIEAKAYPRGSGTDRVERVIAVAAPVDE